MGNVVGFREHVLSRYPERCDLHLDTGRIAQELAQVDIDIAALKARRRLLIVQFRAAADIMLAGPAQESMP